MTKQADHRLIIVSNRVAMPKKDGADLADVLGAYNE